MAERVLVVDDDAPVRRMLERSLSAEGYAVETAADGGGALAAVERRVPDLAVVDVAMPGVDGLALCRRLRAKGLDVPLLLQLIGILPGLGALRPYLLSTQFNAWQGFLRTPVDWAPIVRAAWVCPLYALPSLGAAALVFLRRDVAGG